MSVLGGVLGLQFFSGDKTAFLPGTSTSGHHQIESQCQLCHVEGGGGLKVDACTSCHAEELKLAIDSHPAKKFRDPRNADRLEALDASKCETCHREHAPTVTRPMAVTLPDDYCVRCHQEIAEERPTHEGMGFDTCAAAGCHNFHDNQALYQDFLLKHADEPAVLTNAAVPRLTALVARGIPIPDAPPEKQRLNHVGQWRRSGHAIAGVNCSGCHTAAAKDSSKQVDGAPSEVSSAWSDAVPLETCQGCHEKQYEGFTAGKHGMRIKAGLSPMWVKSARATMKGSASHLELTCNACHKDHEFDIQSAAVDACMDCHNDNHTLAFKDSPHAGLLDAERRGKAAEGTGVSCATCHMPRVKEGRGENMRVWSQHNQSDNLRPNEKMVRSVCMDCHGLPFAIDALADGGLIDSNFKGRPAAHVASIDMAKAQVAASKKARQTAQR